MGERSTALWIERFLELKPGSGPNPWAGFLLLALASILNTTACRQACYEC
jgi:hypothetical protein